MRGKPLGYRGTGRSAAVEDANCPRRLRSLDSVLHFVQYCALDDESGSAWPVIASDQRGAVQLDWCVGLDYVY